MIEPSGQVFQYWGCSSGRGKQLIRNETEKGKYRELTVQEALPKIVKALLKAQDEMRDKKQEIELSVLSAETKWTTKIIDRQTCDAMVVQALEEIENDDEQMS